MQEEAKAELIELAMQSKEFDDRDTVRTVIINNKMIFDRQSQAILSPVLVSFHYEDKFIRKHRSKFSWLIFFILLINFISIIGISFISIIYEKNLVALVTVLVSLIAEMVGLLTILFKYLFNRKENKLLDILIKYLDIQKQVLCINSPDGCEGEETEDI
jgi:hypothetical protein